MKQIGALSIDIVFYCALGILLVDAQTDKCFSNALQAYSERFEVYRKFSIKIHGISLVTFIRRFQKMSVKPDATSSVTLIRRIIKYVN